MCAPAGQMERQEELAISKNVLNFVSTGSKNTFQRSAEKCENFYLCYAEI
jgi:hypothetical protein